MAHKKAGGSSRNGRDSESKRLGFKKCVVPYSIKEDRLINKSSSLRLVPVKTLSDAFDTVF